MIRSRSIGIAIAMASLLLPFVFTQADITGVSSPTDDKKQRAAVVVISGMIDDVERDAFMRRFAKARAGGAKTVIVEIDTYGGLVTSALEMSRYIKRQDGEGVRTIAFVRDKAISAGAMLALACDELIMQPASVIGDCAPIMYSSDGEVDGLPATERAKAESPVLADFLDSAQRNNHDPKLAEAMVVLGHAIHFVESPAGEKRVVNGDEFKTLSVDGWKAVGSVPDPVNASDKLLTIHSSAAKAIGLSSDEFASRDALAKARNLNIVDTFEASVGEEALGWLSTPIARLIVLVIFILSLKFALAAPGHGAPEAISLISLGVLLGIPLLTGYATWLEVLLIFVGLGLLAFEIFVFPGHFVSGIAGILMIVIGLIMTFVGSEPGGPGVLPNMTGTIAAMQRGLLVVTGGMICSVILWIWLSKYLPKIPYFNKLLLMSPGGDPTMMGALGADIVWPLVGQAGRTVTDLKPGGSAEFRDETANDSRPVSVVTEGGFIRAGSDVIVTESRGSRVVVRAIQA